MIQFLHIHREEEALFKQYPVDKNMKQCLFTQSIIKKFVLQYGYIRVYQTLDGIRTADNKLQLIKENCR